MACCSAATWCDKAMPYGHDMASWYIMHICKAISRKIILYIPHFTPHFRGHFSSDYRRFKRPTCVFFLEKHHGRVKNCFWHAIRGNFVVFGGILLLVVENFEY